MSPLASTLAMNLAIVLTAMLGLWAWGSWRRDVSLVDPFWGAGFALVALASAMLNQPAPLRIWMLAAMTFIWGSRLAGYLLWRRWGQPEDRRYAAMRARHGKSFVWVSLASVFLLQGGLLWFIAWPQQVAAAASHPSPWCWLDALGLAVWAVGFAFESIGDWQLARFQADPRNRGRVLDDGLWRWTRHPNYFGDCCAWWGMYLVAAAGGAAWTVASPLLITWLLLRVSGVRLLEADIGQRRPGYAVYQAQTNAFFPGPRRR